MSVSFSTTLRRTAPLSLSKEGRTLSRIARAVLGASYELSVVLCGDALSRRLNRTHRKKDRPTNVLSFPLSKSSGEIYIDIPLCVRESKRFDHSAMKHIYYLFIHGLLHLQGLDHGPTMERKERALLKKYFSR